MRIVAFSDCHNRHQRLTVPAGDVLVVAGDFTELGENPEVEDFGRWLRTLPHPNKVVIAGNHDFGFQLRSKVVKKLLVDNDPTVHYLRDKDVMIGGRKFWGSPWNPWFSNWAFNVPRGPLLAQKWAAMPVDTDVLVVHGPPYGILDKTWRGDAVGDQDLLDRIAVVQPQLVIFGHIHEARGMHVHTWTSGKTTTFLNVATDYGHEQPMVFDLP